MVAANNTATDIADVTAAAAVTAIAVVALLAAVITLQDKHTIFKASVFKSISNNHSAEDVRFNTLASDIFFPTAHKYF